MSDLGTQNGTLEAAEPAGQTMSCAVVRYNPGAAIDWLPDMIAALGWAPSLHTLVTINASAPRGKAPEIVVPPLPLGEMTAEQSEAIAQAGTGAGPWWIAITGLGWSEAMPMREGEAAMLRQLQEARQSEWRQTGGK